MSGGGQNCVVPISNPWRAVAQRERVCPRAILEVRMLNLLSTQNVAVIATDAGDGSPAATPVRFYSLRFEIMYTSWNDSPKSRNLRRDPRVSAESWPPWSGWRAVVVLRFLGPLSRSSVTI